MPARRLEIGEHGAVAYTSADGRVTATFYYRNGQGARRRIEATAGTRTAAYRAAQESLARALSSAGGLGYGPRTTFAEVAAEWLALFEDQVSAGRRSPGSAGHYRSTLDRHVLPAIGQLRLAELTTARLDAFLHGISRGVGHATAKACRSVVSGVCGLAVRRDALRHNPVREVGNLERGQQRTARALTSDECRAWLSTLDASPYAVRKDLPDLVRFMLGTGVSLGEALAITWGDLDLSAGLVQISRTVVRVAGVGLITKSTKTTAGLRRLHLPPWLVEVLVRRRRGRADVVGPVFPDRAGGLRDRKNVERDFRVVRAGTPFEWVVPHTYRKTVATMLDASGHSARVVADQLGHARVSMAQDVYMGRRAVDRAAATTLQGSWRTAASREGNRMVSVQG